MSNQKFYQINYITQIKIANLNGDEGIGGNITTIKKIKGYDNEQYVYISGQALRRYIKETLYQMDQKLSNVDADGNPVIEGIIKDSKIVAKDSSEVISSVIDLDLFGYLLPKDTSLYSRRWSPVKVTPAISLLPYAGEKDYLTRKQDTNGEGKSGNIVQVEIDTFNFMNGTIVIDTDTIGCLINEFNHEKKEVLIGKDRDNRINVLIDSIANLNGGAKQARLLNDFSFKFVVAIDQKYGNPFLQNSLEVIADENGVALKIDPIIEAIKDYKDSYNEINIGIRKGVFSNEDEIIKRFKEININVLSVNDALNNLKIN